MVAVSETAPARFDVPPPAASLQSLIDLPYGAFGRRMRAGCDPLYGLSSMDPEAWADFEEFVEDTGELLWVTPAGEKTPEYKPLWVYRPESTLMTLARAAYRSIEADVGERAVRPARLLDQIRDRYCDPDYYDDYEVATADAEADPESADAGQPVPMTVAAALSAAASSITQENAPANESAPQPAAPVAQAQKEKGPMKFLIEKAVLSAALRKIVPVVPKRTTLPILEAALLRVQGAVLTLIGTDGTQEIRTAAPIVSGNDGAVAVNATALSSIVEALPDGAQVELSLTEGRVRIACGRGRFHLGAWDARDFPVMSDASGAEARFHAGALKKAIDRVAFSIPTNDVHTQLNGLFIHARKDGLRLVAVSKVGMARTDVAVLDGLQDLVSFVADKAQPGVLLPRESVTALRRLLDGVGAEDEVTATFANTLTVFTIGIDRYTTKMLAETFPEYERLVQGALQPNIGTPQRMEVPREAFVATVKRVRILAEDKTRSVHLTMTDDAVRVAASGPSGADAVDTLECDTGLKREIQIGFASAHLIEGVSVFRDGELACIVTNEASPTVWFESGWADPEKADHLVIIMPCRVAPPAGAQATQQAA